MAVDTDIDPFLLITKLYSFTFVLLPEKKKVFATKEHVTMLDDRLLRKKEKEAKEGNNRINRRRIIMTFRQLVL